MKRKRDGNATEDIKSIRKSMKSVRLFFSIASYTDLESVIACICKSKYISSREGFRGEYTENGKY